MVGVLIASLGLIGYTFLGYPAVVAVLSRVRPRPHHRDPTFLPSVSVIIAAHNEADLIVEKLTNTAASDYPADLMEIIVVADGSEDDTVSQASRFPGTKVLFEPQRRGKQAAIVRAVPFASGDVLVLSDANNTYSRDTLRELVAPLSDPEVGVVTGRKLIAKEDDRSLARAEGAYWRYESKLKEWESAIGSVTAVAGEVLAFRHEAFYPGPPGMLTEDFVQAMTAALHGWRIAYAPNALSTERASATLADEATRRGRIVTGRWQAIKRLLPPMIVREPQLAWQIVSHKGLRPLVPCAIVTTAVSTVSLARTRRWARALTLAQLGFYAAAALGRHRERSGQAQAWTYLPYYFCAMNLSAVAGLIGFVRRRQDPNWVRVARG